MIIGYFDGACEPYNPGGLSTGGWIVLPCAHVPNGLKGCKAYCVGDGSTNNVAEYQASIDCLRDVYKTGWRGQVTLYGDSQLVVRQYDGTYRCKAPLLVPLLARLKNAATFFESLKLIWIPREKNSEADEMSRVGYRRNAARFGF